ncbi:putative serine/threonine-protein kinase YabT [Halobacillus andaensis]|uniref:Serine/threonine-protein kinase YabT n=1 Tax=Halobacillus andaensis TaxID=1176239 RepID=A0A917F0A4_HALAA|nr:protein kinase [Halobacillus andaensis]MBP2006659.1 serine/threonine-protein kinase [Halobacillus andaensis]GGF35600.1 putative serine/threonine-protein kinase YabT [Halobacillus andaensis]
MKKPVFNVTNGTLVRGKWNHHAYHIVNKLGEGACGVVYLCEKNGVRYALKVGTESSRLMLEVNMLKKFSKVQGVKLGPSFVDVDDWVASNGQTYPFYVMEYIKGDSFSTFLRGKKKEWVGICAMQLLSDLEHLHQAGYVFGDLKTDNLLIADSKVQWIDVGGVTGIGRAIKEYTEFYDRGYWGYGSRRADPGYDLFAVTMIMLETVYPARFTAHRDAQKTLQDKLKQASLPVEYKRVITDCWQGKYHSARDMKEALGQILMKRVQPPKRLTRKSIHHEASEWGEMLGVSFIALVFYGISAWNLWM